MANGTIIKHFDRADPMLIAFVKNYLGLDDFASSSHTRGKWEVPEGQLEHLSKSFD
jgi:hypothetical protein